MDNISLQEQIFDFIQKECKIIQGDNILQKIYAKGEDNESFKETIERVYNLGLHHGRILAKMEYIKELCKISKYDEI